MLVDGVFGAKVTLTTCPAVIETELVVNDTTGAACSICTCTLRFATVADAVKVAKPQVTLHRAFSGICRLMSFPASGVGAVMFRATPVPSVGPSTLPPG